MPMPTSTRRPAATRAAALLTAFPLGLAACAPPPGGAELDGPEAGAELGWTDTGLGAEPRGAEAEGPARARMSRAPTGRIVMEHPNGWVAGRTFTIGLEYEDDTFVEAYCVSNTSRCTSRWMPIEPEVEVSMRRSAASQRIFVWLRDSEGMVSETLTAMARVDEGIPEVGTITATPIPGGTSLRWSGFNDAVSGVSSYRVMARPGNIIPSCDYLPALHYEGPNTSVMHFGQGPEPWAFRVCAIDGAGWMSVGASARATAIIEREAPVVRRFQITGGDAYTTSREVTLDSDASDASGVSELCWSETATTRERCSPWVAYSPSLPITLSGGEGTKEVRAWLRDRMGNVSERLEDEVVYDRTAPDNGVLAGEVEARGFILTWSDYRELGVGIAGYRVAYALERAPDDCLGGEGVTLLSLGNVQTVHQTGLDGTRYGVRVCGVDHAGNLGNGRTINLRLPREFVPPVLSSVSGPACTTDRRVTLRLDATDDSQVTRMCVNEGAGCTAWLPFDPNPVITLSATPGAKQVVAMVRDEHGNESAMGSTLIELRTGGDADGDGYDVCSDCDDTDPETHPGAVERLTAGDENCDGEADEAAVLYVTGWQCNAYGASIAEARSRTAAEAEALNEYLAEMDLGMDRLDETPAGLPADADLEAYDLVLYSKCGWAWQASNQTTVNALLRAQAAGANTMVFEDDITFRNELVSREEHITLMGQCHSNGTGLGTVTINIDETSTHGAYRGPYGTPTDTNFNWDMDHATELANGAEVIARHSYYGSPVWLGYEDPATGRRSVSMVFNFATANHGTVSDELGLANLEMMFKNSFSWSLGLHD